MSGTDPWVTLGRGHDACLSLVCDPLREVYVALDADDEVVGVLVLVLQGSFVGYIQSVCVAANRRGLGLGSRLMAFAEARIFQVSPNAFICVSSFNPRARALYERLGFEVVGELRDYVAAGHSEWLLRKTTGPLGEFRRSSQE